MGKLAALGRLSVSARVFGGFGLIMGLLVLVAALSGMGMRSVERSVGPVGAASTVMSVVGDFTARQLEVAAQVNAYAASERMQDFEKLKSAAAALATSRDALGSAPLDEKERALVDALTKRTVDYEALVDRSEKAIAESKEAGDELTSLGAAAANAMSALVARLERENQVEMLGAGARLTQSLQGVLVAGTRFLVSGNPGDLDTAKTELDRLTRGLAPVKEATAASERIQKLAKAFEETLPKLAASLKRIDSTRGANETLDKQRRQVSSELGDLVAKLRNTVTGEQRQDLADMQGSVTIADQLGIAVSVAALALGICLAWIIGRGIAKPIKVITATMKRMAGGDYEISVDYETRTDEIGDMARTVEVFRRNGMEVRSLHASQEAAKQEAEHQRKAALETMAKRFEATVKRIVDAVSAAAAGMQETATGMSRTAEKTAQKSLVVASASEQASANVQTVASAAEELSVSIQEIGRQATQASQAIANASAEGKRSDATVTALSGAAQKIGEVVSLINDIASQTNLLALNATIEAARAGEAGKGFAVVASEVKTLATQTAKATGDIKTQIQAIQAETQNAVSAIRGICATIVDVDQISTSISAAVEEQTSATQEIARSVKEVASGTSQVSENIGAVTTDARETGAAAGQVLQAAGALSQQAEQLRSEVEKFLATVRAA